METNWRFFYLQIIRSENGRLKCMAYRKLTHTNRYLDFNSSNPITHQISVIKSLVHRVFNLCSPEYWQDELELIKDTLKSNDCKTN